MRSWIKHLRFGGLRGQDLAAKLSRWQGLNLAVALGFSCILLFISLHYSLETLWDQAAREIQGEIERQADTIARLLAFEFSHLTELLTSTSPPDEVLQDLSLARRLWEKVTFNESIRGIELIAAAPNAEGQYLTYSYYAAPLTTAAAKAGPQKKWQAFSGPEKSLIQIIHREQRVDKALLEAINRGTKVEGELILRYFPLYIPQPERGALYWGVLKVGISREALRRFYELLDEDRLLLRRLLSLVALLGSLAAFFLGLGGTVWLNRYLCQPVRAYGRLGEWLQADGELDLDSLCYHLKRLPTQGTVDFDLIKESHLRLAQASRSLATRLLAQEPEACRGRLQQRLAATLPAAHPGWHWWQELSRPQPQAWAVFDPNPDCQRLRQLLALLLPAEVPFSSRETPLPFLAGRREEIIQALLYLIDFVTGPDNNLKEVEWATAVKMPDQVALELRWRGRLYDQGELASRLSPAQAPEQVWWNLLLARAIARRHAGELQILAPPEGGLHFILTLPAAREAFDASGQPVA